LFVQGALISADKPNPDPLLAWAEGDAKLESPAISRPIALAIPIATALLFTLGQLGVLPSSSWLAALALQWVYALSLLPKLEPVAAAVSSREGALARYRSMLELIEREPFDAASLERDKADLGEGKGPVASQEIRRLSTIVSFLDARHNEVFRFF